LVHEVAPIQTVALNITIAVRTANNLVVIVGSVVLKRLFCQIDVLLCELLALSDRFAESPVSIWLTQRIAVVLQ
jgi:hypothetical protein